jgi:hypothetical protein
MKVLRIRTKNNPEDNLRIIQEAKVRVAKATAEAKAVAVNNAAAKVVASQAVSLATWDKVQQDVQEARKAAVVQKLKADSVDNLVAKAQVSQAAKVEVNQIAEAKVRVARVIKAAVVEAREATDRINLILIKRQSRYGVAFFIYRRADAAIFYSMVFR